MRMIKNPEPELLNVISLPSILEENSWKHNGSCIITSLLEMKKLCSEGGSTDLERMASARVSETTLVNALKELDYGIFLEDDYFLFFICEALLRSSTNTGEKQRDSEGDNSGSRGQLMSDVNDDIAMKCLAMASRSDYGSIASLNTQFRSLLQSGCLYRLRKQLGIVEHWIYLSWEPGCWQAFDPKRRAWKSLPVLRTPEECFILADKESLAVGTELLVFGRESNEYAIWKYSLIRNNWSRGVPMAAPRCLFGSASMGEFAIVAGGCNGSLVLRTAELYNSELGTWETLPDIHTPRKMSSGFFMDRKFYVLGGFSNDNSPVTSGEEFNLQTRTWRVIPNMFPSGNGSRPSHAPPLVAVVKDELYAAECSRNELKKYNKATNTWHVLGNLPLRADASLGWGLGFRACGNLLVIIGGQQSGGGGRYVVLNAWQPIDGQAPNWEVLAVKANAGPFVYNCAVMGC